MTVSNSRLAWFVGEGTLLVRCVEVYLDAGHQIAGVASADPVVRTWCIGRGLTVVDPLEMTVAVGRAPFDFLFSVVNLTRLDAAVIQAPRVMAANFHDGPLPAYAGLNAPVWALVNGESEYGVTWHEMTNTVDAGHILKQQLFDVPADETSFGLNARCYEAGLQTFTSLVDDITRDAVTRTGQDFTRRTLFKRFDRPAHHCAISWTQPADAIARLVRALDFGPYANPFGVARILTSRGAFLVTAVSVEPTRSDAAPGQVQAIASDHVLVATGSQSIAVRSVRRLSGEALTTAEFVAAAGLTVGDVLSADLSLDDDALTRATRHEDFWIERLVGLTPLTIPYAQDPAAAGSTPPGRVQRVFDVSALGLDSPTGDRALAVLTLAAAYLTRLAGCTASTLPFAVTQPATGAGASMLSNCQPISIGIERTWSSLAAEVVRQRQESANRGTFYLDVVARYPGNAHLKLVPSWRTHITLGLPGAPASADALLQLAVSADGLTLTWDTDGDRLPVPTVERLHHQLAGFARTISARPDARLSDLPLVDADEWQRQILDWNRTERPVDEACIHELIERQVDASPDATALIWRDESLTYRDLDARANRLARHLRAVGVGADSMVGVCLDRSVDLVVSLLAVLKAGGAYVPLDPHYPKDRLALVTADAGIRIVIVDPALADDFASCDRVICPARDRVVIARQDGSRLAPLAGPGNLAYVIYTSGSTGKPKGVMIEHRNAGNFFVGMDDCVPHTPPGIWLAVTSISFDISVLELFWTLSRGFAVVLYSNEGAPSEAVSSLPQPIDLSLFYFSADEAQQGQDKYRLLLEGARFADAHDFVAVWTPERHFHAFGGLYPNPAVTGAAVAAITSRVKIRAGSCVLPLHHPLRVAEEWAVVDNISNGRVGIAFASGWQPNDFILRPDSYADRKNILFRDMETVRALWRGERLPFTSPRGEQQMLGTLPRPVQAELPLWVTAAGNPDTFAAAAQIGAGVLTHLLGQTVEELAAKIAAYRAAWREAGHAGQGHVVLMLHTLVSESDEYVREVVREPLMAYLRTSIDLVKPFAESFPTFSARSEGGRSLSDVFASLSDEDYTALVEHSFERYFDTSGLFGRPDTCLAMIDRVKAIGVDEVACLVDFGVATDIVLDSLPHLDELRQRANRTVQDRDDSMAALIKQHQVSHLQCTPSMARMLLLDPATRAALGQLRGMFVGGEALPAGLAAELCDALGTGELWNMYGPTETTVWSTVARIEAPVSSVTVGTPIANTQIYILDRQHQPMPVGLPGDLYIGGLGVARGYWGRPELTAERFIPHPFDPSPGARVYYTGDVARYREDGQIEFLGRSDQQVKIRGHRIELGEIEAALTAHASIREAVVVVREESTEDKRLVAYVIARDGATVDGLEVRADLATVMPEFLVPSHVVVLEAFPLTPNNKIDRKALPAVDQARTATRAPIVPATDLERAVVEIWRGVLRTEHIGAEDNFFDIGGDSLLAAQVLSTLREQVKPGVSLTDLFRFPTVRSLAHHLGGTVNPSAPLAGSTDRARLRQESLKQRRTARQETAASGQPKQ